MKSVDCCDELGLVEKWGVKSHWAERTSPPPAQSQLETTCWGPTGEQRERGLFLSDRDLRLGSTRQGSAVEGFKQEGFGRNRIYTKGWKRMRGFPEAAFLYFRVTLGWDYPPLSWVQAAFCGDRTSCVFLFYTLTCFPHTYFANSTCYEMGTDCWSSEAGPTTPTSGASSLALQVLEIGRLHFFLCPLFCVNQ